MLKRDIENACVGCTTMGMRCQGSSCPFAEHEIFWLECDVCGKTDEDERIYRVGDKDLCEECAFNELSTFNNMLKYIDSRKDIQVDFYFNWICNCNVSTDDISDKALEIVRKECLEYPNMLKDEMTDFCAEDKWDFVGYFVSETDYIGDYNI